MPPIYNPFPRAHCASDEKVHKSQDLKKHITVCHNEQPACHNEQRVLLKFQYLPLVLG